MQFGIWQDNGDTEPKTMNRIAKALGMIPAHTITKLLLELCDEGKLEFVEREKSGRWTARGFLLSNKNRYHEVKARRSITLRKRGVAVGQLEMFS